MFSWLFLLPELRGAQVLLDVSQLDIVLQSGDGECF